MITASFKSARNPAVPRFIQSASLPRPQIGENLLLPTFTGYYVGAKVVISGMNNPFELVNQIWHISAIGSKSAGRL